MKNIEAFYESYEPIVNYFGKEKIEARIAELLSDVNKFIKKVPSCENKIKLNKLLLLHVVMDYFTDIMRLEEFHPVELANKYKIVAYELFWWLRRKPIQILDDTDPEAVFINEKFAVSFIIGLFDADLRSNLNESEKYIDSFHNSLYYYFKYRHFTAQDIEMILLAFQAGMYCQEIQDVSVDC